MSCGRFIHDGDVVCRSDNLTDALADDRMIVGDEHADHGSSSLGDVRRSADVLDALVRNDESDLQAADALGQTYAQMGRHAGGDSERGKGQGAER